MSCVIFFAGAFDITPITRNAVTYLQQFFLTPDGFNALPPTISLDGTNGNAQFVGEVSMGTTGTAC
jgi:hypothetical protein